MIRDRCWSRSNIGSIREIANRFSMRSKSSAMNAGGMAPTLGAYSRMPPRKGGWWRRFWWGHLDFNEFNKMALKIGVQVTPRLRQRGTGGGQGSVEIRG